MVDWLDEARFLLRDENMPMGAGNDDVMRMMSVAGVAQAKALIAIAESLEEMTKPRTDRHGVWKITLRGGPALLWNATAALENVMEGWALSDGPMKESLMRLLAALKEAGDGGQ